MIFTREGCARRFPAAHQNDCPILTYNITYSTFILRINICDNAFFGPKNHLTKKLRGKFAVGRKQYCLFQKIIDIFTRKKCYNECVTIFYECITQTLTEILSKSQHLSSSHHVSN